MSNSKADVLHALRSARPPRTPLPQLTGPWIAYGDIVAQFTQAARAASSTIIERDAGEGVRSIIERLPVYARAERVYSTWSEVPSRSVSPNELTQPRDMSHVDLMLTSSPLAVAENAAMWISSDSIVERATWFLAEHLVVCINASDLVHTMHDAYARVDVTAKSYGCFMAGPSKTADIEQSLVVGAHGARSLTILLRRDAD